MTQEHEMTDAENAVASAIGEAFISDAPDTAFVASVMAKLPMAPVNAKSAARYPAWMKPVTLLFGGVIGGALAFNSLAEIAMQLNGDQLASTVRHLSTGAVVAPMMAVIGVICMMILISSIEGSNAR